MAESYGAYHLAQLWTMVADEEPEAGFTHVNTLNRLRVALEQQRDNLRVQRDRLAESWPPGRSEAAAAFVDRINGMLDVMAFTAGAAGSICDSIDQIYAAIREARRQLEPLVAEQSRRSPGQGLVRTSAQAAELDQRGRDVLIAADAKIATGAVKLEASVPPYKRAEGQDGTLVELDSGTSAGAGGAGSTGAGGGPAAGSSGAHTKLLPAPVFDPPSRAASAPGPLPDNGLLLQGAPGGSPPDTAVPTGAPPGVAPAPVAVPAVSFPFGRGAAGFSGIIDVPRPSAGTGGSAAVPITAGAARPASGQGGLAEGAGSRETAGMPGGYRDRSFESYAQSRRSRRGDADEVWPVEEGVAPVLEAAAERRHDPGPGVLGIDR